MVTAAELGISAFGISIVEMEPRATESRVAPNVIRKIAPGPDGLRLLALGATPGEAYDAGGTL